jgi:hypothetical protein
MVDGAVTTRLSSLTTSKRTGASVAWRIAASNSGNGSSRTRTDEGAVIRYYSGVADTPELLLQRIDERLEGRPGIH